MAEGLVIREIRPRDYPLLEDFLYHAVFLPPGSAPLPREVIYRPDVFVYAEGFGRQGDYGAVAELNGRIVGAAWARAIRAFGHIDDETPELAISVLPECREQGIGTLLLSRLFGLLRASGVERTSLSVQKRNRAVRMYRRIGYEIVLEKGEDYIMVKDLREPDIGRARESDMEEILELQYLAYQSEALIHDDFTIQPLMQTLEESITEYWRGVVLKAVWNCRIIGSVRAYAEGATAFIGKLIVHPAYRGKGLGKRLLSAIELEFPYMRYELFTSCKSDRNLHIYEGAGYTRFREETDDAGIAFAFLEKQA